MIDRLFFDGWVGKIIDFRQLGTMSRWRLVTKLGDLNDQGSALDYLEWQAPSGAYGTFRCRNVDHPDELAVVKIFMQSVLRLHEHMTGNFAIHDERARQATNSVTPFGRDQINALTTLTENNCSSTPTLLAKREFKQDSAGPVPGGFMAYLLMQHLPGVQLNKRVREAFKEALSFIHGFRLSRPSNETHYWMNTLWICWDLAEAPKSYDWPRNTDPHPDMSDWTL
ncbi:hypothetical protein BDV30DRAFT_223992 [Aspergillus minisclerotigenes]|uniref:Uncharacterized protein n=1 Tax=Aspergillus minisclerotigenes TaxID=656917 RepID=A0A5N6JFE1_9EURO|nr:hypothetical protein BDV30DRAFT_223992 [Aspergillus minisclerotigenes]